MGNFGLMGLGFAGYVGVLFVSQSVLARGVASEPLGLLLALSPMLPALVILWAIVRAIRGLDEMQRKLQFEALVLAFAGTALITFSYGFLEGMGLPRLSMFAVWPLMAGLWVIGTLLGRLRYR